MQGPSSGYKRWGQVAGYFDGDGCITIRKLSDGIPFTLRPSLEFTDQSRRQIQMISEFFRSRGIKAGKPRFSQGAWRIEIGSTSGVGHALESMIPHLYKKSLEARALLRYLDNEITGNQVQDALDAAVARGDREKTGSRVDLPWTRHEGARQAVGYIGKFAGRKPAYGKKDESGILQAFERLGSQRQTSRTKGVSRDTVRRVLAKRGLASRHP